MTRRRAYRWRLPAAVATIALLAGAPAGAAPRDPPAVAARPVPPAVTAEGAVLWDPADDRVLYGSAATVPRRMASTTKIMTVLLALEAGTVDDTVTVSPEAVAVGASPGAATLGLRAGQRIAMRSLLAGLILRSGNDAAVAVAEHVAGSEAAFVKAMNARAVKLGLDDTRFLNATGLTDDPDHHASPRDLARLAEVALRDDDFATWAGAARLDLPGLGTLVSRNELLGRYPGATGVKTGYTNLAGLCLVASAARDGRRLITVVLDSQASFRDSAALLDYGYEAFRRVEPVRRGRTVTRYRWADAAVAVTAGRGLRRTVATGRDVVWRTVVRPDVDRPVSAGQVVGRAELIIDGTVSVTAPLRAAAPVPAPAPAPPAATVGGAVQEALRAFVRLQPVDRPA